MVESIRTQRKKDKERENWNFLRRSIDNLIHGDREEVDQTGMKEKY